MIYEIRFKDGVEADLRGFDIVENKIIVEVVAIFLLFGYLYTSPLLSASLT